MILESKPNSAAVCVMSSAFPSASPSLISSNTSSSHNSLRAILSAVVAPTAPAPTTVTFIDGNFCVRLFGCKCRAKKKGLCAERRSRKEYVKSKGKSENQFKALGLLLNCFAQKGFRSQKAKVKTR